MSSIHLFLSVSIFIFVWILLGFNIFYIFLRPTGNCCINYFWILTNLLRTTHLENSLCASYHFISSTLQSHYRFTMSLFGAFFYFWFSHHLWSCHVIFFFICLFYLSCKGKLSDLKSTWSPGPISQNQGSLSHELWKVPPGPRSTTAPSRPPPGLTNTKPSSTWGGNSLGLAQSWSGSYSSGESAFP